MTARDPWFRNCGIREGIHRAIYECMVADPSVVALGEGSHIKFWYDARYILDKFPERILTTPIAEDGSQNFAVGLALAGMKPIVDVISSDFLWRQADALCNTTCKQNAVTQEPKTFVVRAEFLTAAPTSGQRNEACFLHIPGLRVVIPSNPTDAYGLMISALTTPGVTLFYEDRTIEDTSVAEVDKLSTTLQAVPFGAARIRKSGDRVTVVTYGVTTRLCDEVLTNTPYEHIDLRSLWPLDFEALLMSVSHTGALLVVEPDNGGVGAEVIAQVASATDGITCRRVAAPRVTIPASREIHDGLMPSATRILKAAEEIAS